MEELIQDALKKGTKLHIGGEFELAYEMYAEVLKLRPSHADANHNMGLLKLDMGDELGSLRYLQTALQADTSIAQFWLSYIHALIKLERMEEALRILVLAKESGFEGAEFLELQRSLNVRTERVKTSNKTSDTSIQSRSNILDTMKLDQALRLAKKKCSSGLSDEAKSIYRDILARFPENKTAEQGLVELQKLKLNANEHQAPQSMIDRLVNLYNQGQMNEVENIAQELIENYPDDYMLWNLIGAAYLGLNRIPDGLDAFKKVIELNPTFAPAFNNMANALKNQGKLEDAIFFFKKAVRLKPDYPDAYKNLGAVFHDKGKLNESVAAYKKAISLRPKFSDAYNDMGNVLRDQGKLDEAVLCYLEAISLKPDHAGAFNNLGNVLKDQGEFEKSISAYKNAILFRSDYAEAHNNMGRLYWLQRDFIPAFELMEWRWRIKSPNGNEFSSDKPKWSGLDENGIFVWREQGIGDEIMFSSILNELNQKCKRLIVECDKRLISLYKRSFSNNIKFVDNRDKLTDQEFDAQIAIGSLPKYFRHKLNDFTTTSCGWLKADQQKTIDLRKKLQVKNDDKIIGVSWFTNASEITSKQRNIPIKLLAKYLTQLPAKYVSLQYGEISEELSYLGSESRLKLDQIEKLDLFNDLDGLAALISACDVIVSIDNVTVHLAGALGIDTRVLLPLVSDERWGLNLSSSYWYDSATLYRQEHFGDWTKPLEKLVNDLADLRI